MITIALSKGRIFLDTMPILNQLDIFCEDNPETSRKLLFETNKKNIRLIIVRASDVPTYVEWGGADMGIAGKDVLDEFQGKGLFQPLDLEIGKCQLMVAAKKDFNYEVNPKYIDYYTKRDQWVTERFKKVFGNKRKYKDKLSQHHKDIAAALQDRLEEIVLNQLKKAKKKFKYNNLCLAGGVALNCSMNGKIEQSGLFKEIFVFSSEPPYIIAGISPLVLKELISPFVLVFLIVASIVFIKTKLFNTCF